MKHGVTKDEVIEVITHRAFSAGWPIAMNAVETAKELFAQEDVAG